MSNNYNVPLRMLSLTPTRDGYVNPSRRVPDKHIRLFCGKTLDEWLMIQLWSSKYIGKAIFVCETEKHAEKLAPFAEKYGITLRVRPFDFNHPLNDSGLYPVFHELDRELRGDDYCSLVTSPMVVSPCRPPGFFDMMAAEYTRRAEVIDYSLGIPQLLACSTTQYNLYVPGKDGRGTQVGREYIHPLRDFRQSVTNHWVANTYWFWAVQTFAMSKAIEPQNQSYRPMIMEVPWWTDIHIDTEEEWEQAEYCFEKKILSQGEDCYERYRANWASTP